MPAMVTELKRIDEVVIGINPFNDDKPKKSKKKYVMKLGSLDIVNSEFNNRGIIKDNFRISKP
jgi:hypothetical protein